MNGKLLCQLLLILGMQASLMPQAKTASSVAGGVDYYQGGVDAQGRKSGFGMTFYAADPSHAVTYEGLWAHDQRNGLGTSYFHYRQGDQIWLFYSQMAIFVGGYSLAKLVFLGLYGGPMDSCV